MIEVLRNRLDLAFRLTRDLFAHLDASFLRSDLPGLKSNRVAGQVWCIVGARESYLRAIRVGEWQGFACSLNSTEDKPSVLAALEATHRDLLSVDLDPLTPSQVGLAVALLEHEVQHHGQLIRYVYANGLTFPDSWNRRYTV